MVYLLINLHKYEFVSELIYNVMPSERFIATYKTRFSVGGARIGGR